MSVFLLLETRGSSFIWLTKPAQRFGEQLEINSTNVKYYSTQSEEQTPDMTSQPNENTVSNGVSSNHH